MWLGASIHSGDREFRVPDSYPLTAAGHRIDENGVKYIRVKGVRWFTNMDYPQRHEDLILYKRYTIEEYPHYDNYDAINVNYSECDKSMEQLDNVDDSNKRLYELYVMGQKMAQALILGENLCGWVNEGLEFIGMDKVHGDLTNLAAVLLKEMEQYHDELPKEVFEECYGEYDIVENEKHDIAVKLRSTCERLRMLLQMEQRFESEYA